jgi:hypothetical protein
MTRLFALSCRLSSVRKLKARRTDLLMRKSELLLELQRQHGPQRVNPGSLVFWARLDIAADMERCNGQLDVVNAELMRRGLV